MPETADPLYGLTKRELVAKVKTADVMYRARVAEVERLQNAVDVAHAAWTASQYVGGPTEREAYRTAMDALGRVASQHAGTSTQKAD